jgi:branched-chain amino acid transport system ATP-binding protein
MLLEVSQLTVSYGDAPVIKDVSLEISEGEVVGIIGPNGAGKSTLVNSIAGVKKIARGTIKLGNQDISALESYRFVDQGIALVPEGRRIFGKMTVLENLELGSYRKASRSARAASLESVFSLFPILRERTSQIAGLLSGGQQQMVAIGRALMAQPKLLLMDEPSLGLAPLIVAEMFEIIATINQQGVSVLLVEQNAVKALEVSDRAYVLENGRICASGNSANLLRQPEIRQAYLGV